MRTFWVTFSGGETITVYAANSYKAIAFAKLYPQYKQGQTIAEIWDVTDKTPLADDSENEAVSITVFDNQ